MSSKKEALKNSSKALKQSLEDQISDLKENFGDAGKNALWIGGGLITAYALTKLLTRSKKKKKAKKITIQPVEVEPTVENPREKPEKTEGLLSSTVKEQLIIFLLGIATERLTKFLSELETEDEQDSE